MAEWEYCRLFMGHSSEDAGRTIPLDCIVTYTHAGTVRVAKLIAASRPIEYKPFMRAMGLLGSFEWELVDIQHGNLALAAAYAGEWLADIHVIERQQTLSFFSIVAYFKRSVKPGRNVDEPDLTAYFQ